MKRYRAGLTQLFVSTLIGLSGFLASNACGQVNDRRIIPGVSVGVIKLGMLRDKAVSLLGRPLSSMADGDQFEDFTLHYGDDGRVKEIILVSTLYKTDEGISVRSTLSRFKKLYRTSKSSCYSDNGASTTTTGQIVDAVDKGIALDRQVFNGRHVEIVTTLSIHVRSVPATVFGEYKLCK